MRATNRSLQNLDDRLAVDTEELKSLLGCGAFTAREIGNKAGARIEIGRRVLWNVSRIKAYLDEITGENGGKA